MSCNVSLVEIQLGNVGEPHQLQVAVHHCKLHALKNSHTMMDEMQVQRKEPLE
jgi:hypothetical protein